MSKVIFKIHCGCQYFGEAFPNNCAFHYFRIGGVCKTIPKFIETCFFDLLTSVFVQYVAHWQLTSGMAERIHPYDYSFGTLIV